MSKEEIFIVWNGQRQLMKINQAIWSHGIVSVPTYLAFDELYLFCNFFTSIDESPIRLILWTIIFQPSLCKFEFLFNDELKTPDHLFLYKFILNV